MMKKQLTVSAFAAAFGIAALPLFAEGNVPAEENAARAETEAEPAETRTATPPESDVPAARERDEAVRDFDDIYTPARADVRIQQHLITPFYALYSQSLPASISSGGKIAASTYGTGFSWRYVHPEKTRIALSNLDYRRTDYRFSGGNGAAPFSHTDSLRASTYQEFINPENGRALVALLSGSFAAEDGAALSDGLGGYLGLGFKQYFSEETSLALGCTALYRRERERWFFYPFFVFDWRISPNLNLRAINGVTLTWDLGGNDVFLVDFSVEYAASSFSVEADGNENSPYFGRKGAYYEQSVPVSVTGTWNISETFFVSAGVTIDAWSKYRLYRSGHDTGKTFTADPTLEFSLQAGLRF